MTRVVILDPLARVLALVPPPHTHPLVNSDSHHQHRLRPNPIPRLSPPHLRRRVEAKEYQLVHVQTSRLRHLLLLGLPGVQGSRHILETATHRRPRLLNTSNAVNPHHPMRVRVRVAFQPPMVMVMVLVRVCANASERTTMTTDPNSELARLARDPDDSMKEKEGVNVIGIGPETPIVDVTATENVHQRRHKVYRSKARAKHGSRRQYHLLDLALPATGIAIGHAVAEGGVADCLLGSEDQVVEQAVEGVAVWAEEADWKVAEAGMVA